MRILLVEDTVDIGEAIVASLGRLGHAVDWEIDGQVADDLLAIQSYDLVVLDVLLPGLDGIAVLRRLRGRKSKTPVLMLTACSEIDDRVGAFDIGADDYLVKPFDYRELEARVRALLRRNAGEATDRIDCGDLVIDRGTRAVFLRGEPVQLTRRELTLIEILSARPGRIFAKDELVDRLFGFEESPSQNAIEQYVGRVRRKLSGSSVQIRTLRGLGYQLVAP